MAARGLVSYWMLPIISGLVWLATLLGLLLHWLIVEDGRHLPSMSPFASIAFISNIGAESLKPLFITGAVLTTVFLDLSFAAERYLRHNGRLVPNGSIGEKVLVVLTLVFALVGTVGLICLSVFDTKNYKRQHNIFLFLFIAGYMLSAVFICWEYQRLGIRYRNHRILRISFWVKLSFVLVELALAIAFAVLGFKKQRDAAAVVEWIVALIFSFYVFSFIIDLYPAVHTREPHARFPKHPTPREMEEDEEASNSSSGNINRQEYEMDRRPNDV